LAATISPWLRQAPASGASNDAPRSTPWLTPFVSASLTREEHAALASLLGRPLRYANSLQVDVRLVDGCVPERRHRPRRCATQLRAARWPHYESSHDAPSRYKALWSGRAEGGPAANRELIEFAAGLRPGIGLLKRLSRQRPAGGAAALSSHRSGVATPAGERHHAVSQLAAEVAGRRGHRASTAASRRRPWCWLPGVR